MNLEEIQAMIERRKVLTCTDDTHMMIGVAESFNSAPTALYSFLVHPDSFAEAFLYAISLGGDTDTIGAMRELSPGHIWALSQSLIAGKTDWRAGCI